MLSAFSIISPATGETVAVREYAGPEDINTAVETAVKATGEWQQTCFADRHKILSRFVEVFKSKQESIAPRITSQMGRPSRFAPGEIAGVVERATRMLEIGQSALQPQYHEIEGNIERFIEREPLGTILIIAPWNYPFLTVINSLIPALLSGNCVLLKHSQYTALCSEILVECLEEAGLPRGVCQYLHISGQTTEKLLGRPEIDGVIFTGSVQVGRRVEAATAGRFIPVGLELGGKDAAYVRPDADLNFTAENLVEGALFNSGQCCCGIERIYAHADIYDAFIEKVAAYAAAWKPGLPDHADTLMGPVINKPAACIIDSQITSAIAEGAKPLLPELDLGYLPEDGAWLQPQFLTDVTHEMAFMQEETFGPNAGIMKVESDEQAIALINDSEFGLTSSIWTSDQEATISLGKQIQAGTIFMNRCDYLDPNLTWSGVKNSGRGYSLGEYGYLQVTRPKSFHLRRTQ